MIRITGRKNARRPILPAFTCLLMLLVLAPAAGSRALPAMTGPDAVELPVIMYHSVLKEAAAYGEYAITPQKLEQDLIYLSEHGYTAILPREAAEWLRTGQPFPEKPVVLTFDDGYLNNLTYLPALLEQYDMKACIAVVGMFSERFSENPDPNPTYAHLAWDEITALLETGRIEIANHSYDMHRQSPRHGTLRMEGETPWDYYLAFTQDIRKTQRLLQEHCGVTPTTFAYPFGHISKEAAPILQEMGFTVLLTCRERTTRLETPDDLLSVGRYHRNGSWSTGTFMQKAKIQ